jgi:ribosomal protein S18 acetylase RimI-like enzyme
MTVQISKASEYSAQELIDIYNQTRADYMVPMPMTLADWEEYVHVYDIELEGSFVAHLDGEPAGLNLLGLRGDQGWVTRLGVADRARRRGIARDLMEAMLDEARHRKMAYMWLEVIADNEAGRRLFQSYGFEATAELIVAERPDMPPTTLPAIGALTERVGRDEILEKLAQREGHVDWKNKVDSLSKLDGLAGIWVTSEEGAAWVAFRPKGDRLEKTILGVVEGSPKTIGWLALYHLNRLHPGLVVEAENVPAEGPNWSAYEQAGYNPVFRRLEMKLAL